MTSPGRHIEYLVLTDGVQPFLLARVRWPDVCQAVSAVQPQWKDDPRLFDLPHSPAIKSLTREEATAVAANWGARVPAEERVRGAHRIERLTPDRPRPVEEPEADDALEAEAVAQPATIAPAEAPVPRHRWRRRTRAVLGAFSGAYFDELDAQDAAPEESERSTRSHS